MRTNSEFNAIKVYAYK